MSQGSDVLTRAAHRGDPLADRTVAAIMGGLPMREGMLRMAQANRIMDGWTSNQAVGTLAPEWQDLDPPVIQAMQAYAKEAQVLPAWADRQQIERAEAIFMAYGPVSCTLLFCASLPSCYQMPQLAQVLHLSGQLEQHTEHRIRQTAAMVFPVMMRGGLTQPGGSGIAQVLKVRLIHATIRHLILHSQTGPTADVPTSDARHRAWVNHEWDQAQLGVPCSQMELAYTLLTFHLVFLQGMRTLRLGLSPQDEAAYLHAWNVMGHVLGIEDELLAHDMASATHLMHRLEALAVPMTGPNDHRPALGGALMNAMRRSIRLPLIRSLPVPMVERLIGRDRASRVGIGPQAGWLSRWVLGGCLSVAWAFDRLVRCVDRHFSITRMLTRVIGYHMLTRFLLDQTRPLALPEQLLNQIHETVHDWHTDIHSPGWLNRLEDRMTTQGPWAPTSSSAPT